MDDFFSPSGNQFGDADTHKCLLTLSCSLLNNDALCALHLRKGAISFFLGFLITPHIIGLCFRNVS